MPRTNREYALRYADQAINDLERALERLKFLSDMYAGVRLPASEMDPGQKEYEPDSYVGSHGKYQKYVDLVATQIMGPLEDLKLFKSKFM